jgi:protein TonB
MMLPEAPAAAAGLQFEVEEEPTPALGVAEAALLESLPDALPQSTVVSTGLSKAPSSQLASNPLLAPATNPFAAEPTLKISSASAQTPSQPSPSPVSPGNLPDTKESTPRTNSPSVTNNTAGNSAATGTAPAKEIPGAIVNLFETKPAAASSPVTAPPAPKKARDSKTPAKTSTLAARPAKSKSDVEDPNQEAPIEEGSKKNLLIAAGLVLGLAAAGYFAWPTLQPAIMNLGIVRKYLAPQPAPAPVPTPAPVSTATPAPDSASTSSPTTTPASDSSTASPGTNPQEQSAAVAPSESQPQAAPSETSQAPAQQPEPSASAQPAAALPTPKPSAQTTHLPQASPRVIESHLPTAPRATAPVVVKDDIKKDAPKRPITSPAPLEVTTGPTDKTLAGPASAAPVIAAKPALQVIRVSQDVSNGLLIKRVQPLYPTLATQMRVEGEVELDATITTDGNISDIKVLKGDPMLARAAVDAVRQWKYKPYLLDGQPVQLQTQITVNFKLPL